MKFMNYPRAMDTKRFLRPKKPLAGFSGAALQKHPLWSKRRRGPLSAPSDEDRENRSAVVVTRTAGGRRRFGVVKIRQMEVQEPVDRPKKVVGIISPRTGRGRTVWKVSERAIHQFSQGTRRDDLNELLLSRIRYLAPEACNTAESALGDRQTHAGSSKDLVDALLLAAADVLTLDASKQPELAERRDPEPGRDPLQAARDRGMNLAVQEWNKPENLTLQDAAMFSGRSDGAINQARKLGKLYALVPLGKSRGFRYPSWQFHADPDRLAAVLEPLLKVNASCWVVHNFMQRPLDRIDGARPMDWILANLPLEPLLGAIEERYTRDQGAA